MKKTLYSLYLKRIIDFNLAIIALIILSPLLILVTLLQIIFSGFPIFFTQERVGKDEKIFRLIKFRTMKNLQRKNVQILREINQVEFFGRFLRFTSIDELPSLINILKGDMAFIGPRPLLVDYLPFYNYAQKQRHLVRPGLSGLAQVNGRNLISWQEKFNHDIDYVVNISFFLDIKLLLFTVFYVLKAKGIYSKDNKIVEKFNGKN